MLKRYVPLSQSELNERSTFLSRFTTDQNQSEMLALFNNIQSAINHLFKNTFVEEKKLLTVTLGTWLLLLIKIESEYHFLSPHHHKLYQEICKQLNISDNNPFTLEEKLIHLTNLFEGLSDTGILTAYLNETDVQVTKKYLIEALRYLLKKMGQNVRTILHSIPSEKALDVSIANLSERYTHEKDNQKGLLKFFSRPKINERQFLIQLAMGIKAQLNSDTSEQINGISRIQQIKMGTLLLILREISQEYYLRSPTNSELYRLAQESLNIDRIEDITINDQLNALTALKHFLNDNSVIQKLSSFGESKAQNYLVNLDVKIETLQIKLSKMIEQLSIQKNLTNWPTTMVLSKVGSTMLSTPGYGLGYVLGYISNETKTASNASARLGSGLHHLGTAYFATNSGGYFGFLVADFIIQSVLTRAFAKLLEQFGSLLGSFTGGVVGLSVDLTYKGFQEACSVFLDWHHEVKDRISIESYDLELIKALMKLPQEVFEESQKNRLKMISSPQLSQSSSIKQNSKNDCESIYQLK